MKRQLWMVLAFLLALGSCSQEEWQNQEATESAKDLIVASFEGKGSRASILEKSLIWNTGDQIAVMDENGEASPFTLLPEYNGLKTGEFEGVMPENPKAVVFPYVEDNAPELSGNTLSMSLPNVISGIDQCNLPMWSVWNGEDIYFKHLVGLLAVSVNDIPVGYNSLKLTASNVIAGTFVASDITQSEVILTAENGNEANKTVTVHFEEVVANADNEDNDRLVYIPLPVGTYANIKVSLSNGTDELELKTWTNKVVQRAKIYSASLTYIVVEATTTEGLTNALKDAFKTEDTTGTVAAPEESRQVEVVGQITATDEPIVVPAAEEGKTSDISMNFNEKPITTEETPLMIEQNWTDNAESQEATNNLTINMPTPKNESDKIEHVIINTPTTTTSLNGGTYTKITATTAINTLVLGEGTVIENLIIGGGNIRLQGGQITTTLDVSDALKKKIAAGDDKIFIIMENSASYNDLPAGFKINDNDYFQIVYADEYDFRQAIAKGGDVVMSSYVKCVSTEPFEITKSTTIDLNGYGIYSSGDYMFSVMEGVELILKDSYPSRTSGNWIENNNGILNNGGVVNIMNGKYRGKLVVSNGGCISITGGQFSEDPSEFVAEGFVARQNANNTNFTVYETITIENEAFSKGLMTTAQLQGKIELNENRYAVIAKPDAEAVTEISMNNVEGGIAVVDHLEMFPNLQTLSCTYCGVQEIVIPENNVLKSLNLNDNSLTNLDLSHATGLTYLSCRSNNLTTLDLSKLTALNTLFCYGNKLDELDLTMHSALTDLLCGAQQDDKTLILKLSEEMKDKWNNDFYNYGENSNVDLEGEVTIRNRELSTALVELYKNGGLTLPGEVALNSAGYAVMTQEVANAVYTLDFGFRKYTIPSMSGIEKFKNLRYLRCVTGGVEKCDVSQNTKLEYVNLNNNNLTSLEFNNHPDLSEVHCGNNSQLTTLNVEKCKKLTSIDFSGTALTSIIIPNWQNLKHLDYSNTHENISFDLSQFTQLEGFFAEHKGLTSLNFSSECKKTLNQLNVSYNNLTSFDFSGYDILWSFHCGYNQITELDLTNATELGYFSCDGNYIKSLDITKTLITDVVADEFRCGNQRNDIVLKLTLTPAQQATCTDEWRNANPRVSLPGEEGTGNLDEFGNGGIF